MLQLVQYSPGKRKEKDVVLWGVTWHHEEQRAKGGAIRTQLGQYARWATRPSQGPLGQSTHVDPAHMDCTSLTEDKEMDKFARQVKILLFRNR